MPVNAMKRYLALFLTLCLILCSCAPGGSNGSVSDKNSHSNTSFQEYTDALFRESVSSDALSLNYSLAHPENYGISKTAGGFPPLSVSETAQASSEYENALAKLESFDRNSLSEPEKILYDNLKYTLEMNQKGEEFFLFSRPFSPVTGIQAQLPVLLAEYTFDCREDIASQHPFVFRIGSRLLRSSGKSRPAALSEYNVTYFGAVPDLFVRQRLETFAHVISKPH